MEMRLTDKKYFEAYQQQFAGALERWFSAYEYSTIALDLSYRNNTSAVYSSNIEGNSIDVNSFMNSIISKTKFKPNKDFSEINDLVKAYEFAQQNELTEKNILKAHKILSHTLLIKDKRGKYRTDRMGVFDSAGLVYLAIEDHLLEEKMKILFSDIEILKRDQLNLAEAFYHASLLHLIFVHLHPFWDGNGRTARLLEKWFLATVIGAKAWKIQSEKYYKEHLSDYYRNINLGVNYYELDYDKCLPFLFMLPYSLQE